jgi:hypothetical protein
MFFIEEPYFTELLRSTRGDVDRLPEIVLQAWLDLARSVMLWLRRATGVGAHQDPRPSFPSSP